MQPLMPAKDSAVIKFSFCQYQLKIPKYFSKAAGFLVSLHTI